MPEFELMSLNHKLLPISCPTTTEIAVCVSRYLEIISKTRKKLDEGLSEQMLSFIVKSKLPNMAYFLLYESIYEGICDEEKGKTKLSPNP